jgi:hypothetical protein
MFIPLPCISATETVSVVLKSSTFFQEGLNPLKLRGNDVYYLFGRSVNLNFAHSAGVSSLAE